MNRYKTGDKVVDKTTKKVLHVVEANELGDLKLIQIINSRVVETYEKHSSEVRPFLDENLDLGDVSDHLKY
jgi:hypothetical protein